MYWHNRCQWKFRKIPHNSVKKWIQNELQKCSIGESKAMPDKDGSKQLTCTDDADAAKIITAVSGSLGGQADFKNPWDTTAGAIKASAGPGTGACAKSHRGYSYLTVSGSEINIFTCTMQKDGDDNNEISVNVPTN